MTTPVNASRDTVRASASGAPPFDAVMAELRRLPRAQWLDQVRSDQSHRWRRRAGVAAEEYFRQLPELHDDDEAALVVINGEILLRSELGETPALAEYKRRFPELGERIAVQFEVNSALAAVESSPCDDGVDEFFDAVSPVELPGYTLLEEVGVGSCGVVYRARQQSLSRDVAVKVVRTMGADEKQLARQRQEAEVLGRLQHPNVVQIHEVLESRGLLYLVMELVPGTTLAERINGRPLAPTEAAELARTLARAVHAVHEAGVLHRDLKPSNVLLTPQGEVKITDFGLAKLQSQANSLTARDSIIGTPSYMAPEQAGGDGHATDERADVYSLGAVLYELLSGRPPFLGATVLDTLALIRGTDPVPLRRLLPRLPLDLETICLKCLAKTPTARYATAAALAEDLKRFSQGDPIAARRPSAAERMWRAARRRPALATAVAGLMALAAVVATGWSVHRSQQRRLEQAALVESIATADMQALPQLLDRLPRDDATVDGRLRAARADVRPPESRWVNLGIAEATANPGAPVDRLLDYLPEARPAEMPLLASTLASRRSAVVEQRVWALLADETAADEVRLRAGCVAARISQDDLRWKAAAPAVARALVRQHPVDVGTFTTSLRSVSHALVAPLSTIYRDDKLEPVEREVAAGILAQFAADDPAALADLIVEADPSEFRLLLAPLEASAAEAFDPLQRVADEAVDFDKLSRDQTWETRHVVEMHYDGTQRRRAVALTALWRLGRDDAALTTLSEDAEPALRAWLIELLGSLGVSAEKLIVHVREAEDPITKQGLLLAVGGAPLPRSLSGRERLATDVLTLYRNDPDAGVHAACRWLLANRLGASERLAEADRELSGGLQADRDWYLGANGHTFSVLRGPLEFTMGSPTQELSREEDEAPHAIRLDYGLAVAAHEVTIAQFLRFRDKFFNRRYSASDDCPANNITWFDAAAYCRWLSEQEGLPDDQMCYPPVDEIDPGMRLPSDWRQRTGYRLPTEAEWEYACRGGVQASRFPGEGKLLLSRYAWFIENSDDHAWPVGQLKPNNFGLFDMLGNVTERCFDRFTPNVDGSIASTTPAVDGDLVVEESSQRPFRGANFGDAEHNLRSARRNANSASDQWALIGFRPVRVIRP